MTKHTLKTWQVEGTLPTDSSKGSWRRNVNMTVICATLEEVIPAVRERHPEFVFVKVMSDRWLEDVIVVERQEPS